ncbi:MAG: GNAT family N-acetyltransferase [Phycisphaerae bacterium]|nr:GNAT family N-acetyltransferase [Phycisphaerae bacterium]
MLIRLARPADLVAINDIYNYDVLQSNCTYQTKPESPDERRAWFEEHGEGHPVTVAERSGEVVGWGSLSSFRSRAAYARIGGGRYRGQSPAPKESFSPAA